MAETPHDDLERTHPSISSLAATAALAAKMYEQFYSQHSKAIKGVEAANHKAAQETLKNLERFAASSKNQRIGFIGTGETEGFWKDYKRCGKEIHT